MTRSLGRGTKSTKPSTHLDTSPKSEPTQELDSRAAPSVEAHQRVSGPNTGRNSGGRWIKNKKPRKTSNLFPNRKEMCFASFVKPVISSFNCQTTTL